MELTIGSELRIKGAGKELRGWCMENLVLPNPEYADRIRRGLWIGRTPQYLYLYRVEGEELVLPVGTGKDIRQPSNGAIYYMALAFYQKLYMERMHFHDTAE